MKMLTNTEFGHSSVLLQPLLQANEYCKASEYIPLDIYGRQKVPKHQSVKAYTGHEAHHIPNLFVSQN